MRARAVGLITWSSSMWAERLALAGLVFSIFAMGLGTAWDIHWHAVVSRDSMWIPPHILVYSGAVMAGFLGLATLARTFAAGDLHGMLAGLRSSASLGYGAVGVGAAIIAVAAVFDDIWHRTVGDLTVWSPPHVLGVIGALAVTLGTTVALMSAGRRGVISDLSARTLALLLMASIYGAAYFALLAPAHMLSAPGAARFGYFFDNSPYLVAGMASLLLPALTTCVRRLVGRSGFDLVAVAVVAMWGAQEVFHLVATPLVAGLSGYAVKANAYRAPVFELLVMVAILVPAVVINRLGVVRAWTVGAMMGGLYALEVAAWTGMLRSGSDPVLSPILVVMAIGAASAMFGERIGQWLSAGFLGGD